MKLNLPAHLTKLIYTLIFSASATILTAKTIQVTNTKDSGTGSLRDAVSNASASDVIKISPSLLGNGNDTIHLKSTISIGTGITIEGTYSHSDTIFISGGDSVQLFSISIPVFSSSVNVTMDSLVLVHGKGEYGGAINFTMEHKDYIGQINISNCIFRHNSGTAGGAIGSFRSVTGGGPAATAKLEISRSQFIDNHADKQGGAIFLFMSSSGEEAFIDFDMTHSTVLGNTAQRDGGGIYLRAYNSSSSGASNDIDISYSSICKNQTVRSGGGLYAYTYDRTNTKEAETNIWIITSTISDNKATVDGGGIFSWATDLSELRIETSTLYKNSAIQDGSAFYSESPDRVEFRLESSIFALNDGNSSYDNTFFSDAPNEFEQSDGWNIFDATSSSLNLDYWARKSSEKFGAKESDIALSDLKRNSNGSYTRTPGATSIAINAGNSYDTTAAQNGPITGTRDIGAAESEFCDYVTIQTQTSICDGDEYDFYGKKLSQAGTYRDTTASSTCDTIRELTLSITPNKTPKVSIYADPGTILMQGTSVAFKTNATDGGNSPSFVWYVNGNAQTETTDEFQTSTLAHNDSIWCEMTSSLECTTQETAVSNGIPVQVHKNNDEACDAIDLAVNESCVFEYFSNAGATQSQQVAEHSCATESGHDIWFSFKSASEAEINLSTLAGSLTDAVITVYDGTCNALFEVGCINDVDGNKMPQGVIGNQTKDKKYFIRVSGVNALSGSFAICLTQKDTTIGVQKLVEDSRILMYPNPAGEHVVLEVPEHVDGDINIFNAQGVHVESHDLAGKRTSLNVSGLSEGIYFVKIRSKNGFESVLRLVISR